MLEQFKKDVEEGLSSNPKYLSSKYFYDKKGDELFVQIMNLPEYYLTRAEFEIFTEQTTEIIDALGLKKDNYFELIELGAGDGTKTKELLKGLSESSYQFDYFPIDISQNALNGLEDKLKEELPNLSVQTRQGDYFEVLASLKDTTHPKVLLFLGSNIGNLSDELATDFIYKLGSSLKLGDKLFLGVDLIKPSSIVLPAYNDSKGVTRAFNLNLLDRINRELGGNFDTASFQHSPEYLEIEGIAKSYIESLVDQEVRISGIDKVFLFKKGERIHTEVSRKYNDGIIRKIIKETDFKIINKFLDNKKYFADYILERG